MDVTATVTQIADARHVWHPRVLGEAVSGPTRCARCDKPIATQADHDATREGESADADLCWAEYGTPCERIDWRALALAAADDCENWKRVARESQDERDAAEAERDDARAHLADLLPERDALWLMLTQTGRERDKTLAALAALREAAIPHIGAEFAGEAEVQALRCAVNNTPAALADQYRARVRAEALREAADACDAVRDTFACMTPASQAIAERCGARLRALAAEADRGK